MLSVYRVERDTAYFSLMERTWHLSVVCICAVIIGSSRCDVLQKLMLPEL